MEKVCARCKEAKPVSEFNKCSGAKDGLNWYCKQCARTASRLYKQNHKERHRLQSRIYWDARRHRLWAINTIRHHKKKHDVRITKDELTALAQKVVKCPLCKIKLRWKRDEESGRIVPNSPTLDRVDNGDVITLKDAMIICYRCNSSKGARTLKEFKRYCMRISQLNIAAL
jgi:hypothetical protein